MLPLHQLTNCKYSILPKEEIESPSIKLQLIALTVKLLRLLIAITPIGCPLLCYIIYNIRALLPRILFLCILTLPRAIMTLLLLSDSLIIGTNYIRAFPLGALFFFVFFLFSDDSSSLIQGMI
jgi:hypothetical protein